MSVKPTTDDGEVSEKSAFKQDAEAVLEELDGRFQENSKTFSEGAIDNLIIIPEHGREQDDGSFGSVLFYSSEERILEKRNFSHRHIASTSQGTGVQIWFKYDN